MWIFVCVCALLIILFYQKCVKPLSYWKEKNVIYYKAWPIVGSLGDLVMRKLHFTEIFTKIYNQYPEERYVGFMNFIRPALMIRDIDLIKQMGIKDFDHFPDHVGLSEADTEPILSKSIINLRGNQWRKMRATLSPVFTSSKMKQMYKLMEECAYDFVNHLDKNETTSIEVKDLFIKYTNDVIATTAFGVKTNSCEDPNNDFFSTGKKLITLTALQTIKAFILTLAPRFARLLKLRIFDEKLAGFFRSLIIDTMEIREKNNIIRPDLIHLLMQAKKGQLKHEITKNEEDTGFATAEESDIGKTNSKLQLDDESAVAQALIFFFAGFDTSATECCFIAYELALNPDCQKKLQEEIDAVNFNYGGHVPYDVLLSIKYLDQVISETLRLWPPAFQTDRLCQSDYTIQPNAPHERSLKIEKGMNVIFPIMAIHRDPKYFPEPNRFDPERFSDENKSNINPSTYLPFGVGPRNCIGSRFALLEIKTLFFHILSKFDIIPVEKTEIPMKFHPKKLQMAPLNGFWLGFHPRKVTVL